MVVIKDSGSYIESTYGKDFVKEIKDFASVIGFSVEEGDEIKVEFNPDRPDLFSFLMLERALRIYNGVIKAEIPVFPFVRTQISVDPETRKVRNKIGGLYAVGPVICKKLSPLIDYQEKLHSSIGRDRKKVSIGIHDLDKIFPPFSFQMVNSGEVFFETYDSIVSGTASEILERHPKAAEYGYLIPDRGRVPVLSDSKGQVLSMPPIINGKASVVTEKTSRFFVDITGSDTASIRACLFCLSYMFHYMGYSVSIISEDDKEEQFISSYNGRSIVITDGEVKKIIGTRIDKSEMTEIFRRMGYAIPEIGMKGISVPGNRVDVMGPADVIEDLAKGLRYEKIAPARPALAVIGKELPERKGQRDLRELLIGSGFQEIMSYVVTSSKLYGKTPYNSGVTVSNPKSLDFSIIRDRLYLNMLDFLRLNRSNSLPQKVFEIGDVIIEGKQVPHVAIGVIHSKASYSELYSSVRYILSRIYEDTCSVETAEVNHMIPGRSGSIKVGSRPIGVIGEIKPETLIKFDLQNPVVMAEFSFP